MITMCSILGNPTQMQEISKEEALKIANEFLGKNFNSLIELYEEMTENALNEEYDTNELLYLLIGKELLPNNELDSMLVMSVGSEDDNISTSRHLHGIPISDSDKQKILKFVNSMLSMFGDVNFDSYEEIKSVPFIKMMSATGVMRGLFVTFWIDGGEIS